MPVLNDLFQDGWLVDFVLVFIAVEYVAVVLLRMTGFNGISVVSYTANCTSGASLMLCLREALGQANAGFMAMMLIISGLAHAVDVWSRWSR